MAENDPASSAPRERHNTFSPFNPGPFVPRGPRDEERFEAHGQVLGFFDVFSLIVNKMIGTGIYTSPTAVFLLTGNKSLTLGLFAIGLFYCLVRSVLQHCFLCIPRTVIYRIQFPSPLYGLTERQHRYLPSIRRATPLQRRRTSLRQYSSL